MPSVRLQGRFYYATFYAFGRYREKRLVDCASIPEARERAAVVFASLRALESNSPYFGEAWAQRVVEYGCSHPAEGLEEDLSRRVGVLLRGDEEEVLTLDLLPRLPDPIPKWPFCPGQFFAAAHDRVLLGSTPCVLRKLRAVQEHCPHELRLLAVAPVGSVGEGDLERIEPDRVPWVGRGWYYLRGPLVDIVRRERLRWDSREMKKKTTRPLP